MRIMLRRGMGMIPVATALLLTEHEIDAYLKRKLAAGVSAVTAAKCKTPLYQLYHRLGGNKEVSATRLQEWQVSLVAHLFASGAAATHWGPIMLWKMPLLPGNGSRNW